MYGRLSLKEGQWFEEEDERGIDSYHSTSFENTPSPQSVPSVERSASESSYNSAGSPQSIEEAAPTRTSLNTVEPALGPMKITEASKTAVPATVQPGFTPGTPGGPVGPPPSQGMFFNNPAHIRTLVTGSGDGYRSPEPPSRLDSILPFHPTHREQGMAGGGPTYSGFDLSGMATERTGPSFSAQQPAQPANSPGYGPWPPLSSSSVLPAELMVYNDLMMALGTGQYLGTEMMDLGPPPFIHPSMSSNDGGGVSGFGTNRYQWQGTSQDMMQGPPQTISLFGYPQQGQSCHGGDYISGQQTGASFEGQWPTGGIVDYR